MTEQALVTIVNHVARDIAVPPEAVWASIVEQYVEAKKFREDGTLTELGDPAAVLGGYRMRLKHGDLVDERVIRITELDPAAHRLSIYAHYQTVPVSGMEVWVTYHAQEAGNGARYAIDCHSRLHLDVTSANDPDSIAAAIDSMKSTFDIALLAYLDKIKATLEGAS